MTLGLFANSQDEIEIPLVITIYDIFTIYVRTYATHYIEPISS